MRPAALSRRADGARRRAQAPRAVPAAECAPTAGRKHAALHLEAHEVQVWRAQLDEQPPSAMAVLTSLLSGDEQDRARRFYFERERRRFIVARGVLRSLLGRYTGLEPGELEFRYGPQGKPALAETETRPIHFNVTHSEGLALYAFSRGGELGIDVERIREMPDWESIARVSFSARELERLRGFPEAQRREEFFRAWTRQEAILKAIGTGLGFTGRSGADEARALTVHPLQVGPGFAAALATSPTAHAPQTVSGWTNGAWSGFERSGSRTAADFEIPSR